MQRQFKRTTHSAVMRNLLENELLYRDAIAELDKQVGNVDKVNEQGEKPVLVLPSSKLRRTEAQRSIDVDMRDAVAAAAPTTAQQEATAMETRQSYMRQPVSSVARAVLNLAVGKFPFLNRVDKITTDIVDLKQQHSGSRYKLDFVNQRYNRKETFIKCPVSTNGRSFQQSSEFLNKMVDTISSNDFDDAGAVRRITKHFIKRNKPAVMEGLKECGIQVATQIDTISETAMFKAG